MIGRRGRRSACAAVLLVVAGIACGRGGTAPLTELQRVRSGNVDVVLLSPNDALRHEKDTFFIELRSTSGGALIDGGTLRVNASMSMSGVPMFGAVDVERTDVAGRYEATADLGMAGRWRLTVEWDGAAEPGSASFSASVL